METNIKENRIIFQITVVIVFLVFSIFNACYAQDPVGVLVVSESSPVKKANVLEIRRIYLGLPSSADSLIKNPVINSSSQDVYKAFLKNIMHMTEKGYQRKIIKRIFRQGGEKVKEIQSISELVNYLNKNIYDVSFMSESTAKKTKGIKVVQVLW